MKIYSDYTKQSYTLRNAFDENYFIISNEELLMFSDNAKLPCNQEILIMLASERVIDFAEISNTVRIQCNLALTGNSQEKFRMYNLKISKEQGEIEAPNFEDIKRISSSSVKNVAWNTFKNYIETFDVLSLAEENPVQDFG